MVNVQLLRQIKESRPPNPSLYDNYVFGIVFARAELGINDDEIPNTLEEIEKVYQDLEDRLPRPSQALLDELDEMLELTGGTMDGEPFSEGETLVIIEQCRDELVAQVKNAQHVADASDVSNYAHRRRRNELEGEELDQLFVHSNVLGRNLFGGH